MGNNKSAILLFLVVLSYALVINVGGYGDEYDDGGIWREMEGEESIMRGNERFLLQHLKHVVKTDAGDMRVTRGFGGRHNMQTPMHIGFITMEPKSLFIPQYLDSNLIIFIRKGEARIGYIYKDKLAEKTLKDGDVYRIPAGSAFYLVNKDEGQKLHAICSIDTSESLGWHSFRSFFIGGGTYPTSILAGFDHLTLSTAFNVSMEELRVILTRQQSGPIVHLSDSHAPTLWTKFLDLEEHHRLAHLKRVVQFEKEEDEEEDEKPTWSWRKLLITVFGEENKKKVEKKSIGPDSYNIYDRKPDYKNDYGWSMALDESDYSPLKHSGIGIYLVNLTAGAMMAPHINPMATEYGIVLKGSGTIQIVYPNGTLAMNAKVTEGDVFWVPRYFPFCQIASKSGQFEFFGFTTSARKNRPQFLVGANSLMETMRGSEMAAAFGVSEARLKYLTNAQRESVILPPASNEPPEREEMEQPPPKVEMMMLPMVIKDIGSDMIMGFD